VSGIALVESLVEGSDHRLLVVGGRLMAAVRRDPPSVTGDGQSTLRQLIAAENHRRHTMDCNEDYRPYPVAIDADAEAWARRQGLALDDVPAAGRRVRARGAANFHAGGVPRDVLDSVHPEVRALAESVGHTIGIHALGIDFITPDVSRSWREVPCAVIEINQSPGIYVHGGSGVDTRPILDAMLEPVLDPARVGRVPTLVVLDDQTGAVGAKLVEALRGRLGVRGLGSVLPGATNVGELVLQVDSHSLHDKVGAIFANRDCERALICCTPQQVAEAGFPVGRCDIVAVRARLELGAELDALVRRCARQPMVVDPADAASVESACEAFSAEAKR
jgi:cyanophycin synthetase